MKLFSTLTREQVAHMVGIQPQSVSRWHRKGCPRNADGTYAAREVIAWLCSRSRHCWRCGWTIRSSMADHIGKLADAAERAAS